MTAAASAHAGGRGQIVLTVDEVTELAELLALVEDWLLHTDEMVLDDLARFGPSRSAGGARPVIDALGDTGVNLAHLLGAADRAGGQP